MSDSSQHKVGKVRPPRVQISYDVEEGGASSSRELPLVAGVVSDLSGDSEDPLEYNKRGFVEVEQGGVDKLMKQVGPTLNMQVDDKISGEDDAQIGVNLEFNSIDDFSPMGIATQVPQTAELLKARQQLADLYGKVEANEKLDGILGDVLADEAKLNKLQSELGPAEGAGGDSGDDSGTDS